MYPKPTASAENHKRGFCSDGAPVHLKSNEDHYRKPDGTEVDHPPFPQPCGIFVNQGREFNPIVFLTTIRTVYECIVIERGTGGERAMEFEAFAEMLRLRIREIDGTVYFKLYKSVELSPLQSGIKSESGLILDHTDGGRYLRLDSLQDSSAGNPMATENNMNAAGSTNNATRA